MKHKCLIILGILLLAFNIGAQDVSRKIIHIEQYQPIPGDVYTLIIDYGTNLNGEQSLYTYNIPLQEDYTMEVPILGSVNAEGLEYSQLRQRIIRSLKDRIPAQYIDFSLSAPAIFDVFVYGSVKNPGTATATSLNRLTEVIAIAGGFTDTASRRRVQLNRKGTIRYYDFVKYYIEGNEEENPYIKPGDRIFVSRVENAIQLQGAVANAGEYEILKDEDLGDIIDYAGGLSPAAQLSEVTVSRLNEENRYEIIRIEKGEVLDYSIKNGDVINIPSADISRPTSNRITVEGALYGSQIAPGDAQPVPENPIRITIPYQPGMTLLMVLRQLGGPTPFAETERTYLIRTRTGERMPIPDLAEIWEEREKDRDIALEPGDHLVIPMENIQIIVGGEVNAPDAYPYLRGLSVGDYIKSARGIDSETGSLDEIYLIDELGKRTKTGLGTLVEPGDMIYVGKNSWTVTQEFFSDFFVVTGWITGIIGVTLAVLDFGEAINLWSY